VKEKRNKAHNSNSTIHRSDGAVVAQEFLGGFSRRTGKAKIPVRPVTNAFQLSHHFFFNKHPKTLYHDNPVRPVTNAHQYYYHFYTNKYPKTLYHDNPVRPVKEKRKKAHNSDSKIHRSDGAVIAQEFLGGFSRRTGKRLSINFLNKS